MLDFAVLGDTGKKLIEEVRLADKPVYLTAMACVYSLILICKSVNGFSFGLLLFLFGIVLFWAVTMTRRMSQGLASEKQLKLARGVAVGVSVLTVARVSEGLQYSGVLFVGVVCVAAANATLFLSITPERVVSCAAGRRYLNAAILMNLFLFAFAYCGSQHAYRVGVSALLDARSKGWRSDSVLVGQLNHLDAEAIDQRLYIDLGIDNSRENILSELQNSMEAWSDAEAKEEGSNVTKGDFLAAIEKLEGYPVDVDLRSAYKIMSQLEPSISVRGVMFSAVSSSSTVQELHDVFASVEFERQNFGWVTIVFFVAWGFVATTLVRLAFYKLKDETSNSELKSEPSEKDS